MCFFCHQDVASGESKGLVFCFIQIEKAKSLGDAVFADLGRPWSRKMASKSTIWIGNIDTKATEAHILKLVKPHGKVVKFDFVYTHTGSERVPRGYAFVTFDNYVSADAAIKALNGVAVLSKHLKVQLSSSTNTPSSTISNTKSLPLSLSMGSKQKSSTGQASSLSKIKAMEARLKVLEQKKSDEFTLALPGLETSKRPKPYDKPCKRSK